MTYYANLQECIRELSRNNYYNGGQTVTDKHPTGSESRARVIAEANFWLEMYKTFEENSGEDIF